ncbi:MAG TPA: glycosyltransferase family 9 protein [Candidatus Acidoferrales bacterium]|nr:glycosyltransferase family 9 protein [Candidatus Acidoferrales bacterium]
MTIRFMKFMDEYIGTAIVFLLAILSVGRKRKREKKTRNILVIKFWGMGSVTLSMPLLAHLKRSLPGAKLHYLTLAGNSELCSMIGEIDFIHTISLTSATSFLLSTFKAVTSLRRHNFEMVFDLEFFTNISAIICRVVRARDRIGFQNSRSRTNARSKLYTDTKPFHDNEHVAVNFLRLADKTSDILFPHFKVDKINDPEPMYHHMPVAFNINASPLAYERRWSPEEFGLLADFLAAEFGAHIMLTGSQEEREYVEKFSATLTDPSCFTNVCGELTVGGLIGLLQSCQLIVTNDSGPLHLASALNIPTISFFGPESPVRYGSLSSSQLTFYKRLWCSPCMTVSNLKTVNCINNRQCMKQIHFVDIKESIRKFVTSILEGNQDSKFEKILAERL